MFDFESIDIEKLIPQRKPFIMIDKLITADTTSAVTQWKIQEDALFLGENTLNPCAFIENMAQTCAAQLGFVDKYLLHVDNIRIGYIGALKDLKVFKIAKISDILTTKIEIREQIMNMKLAFAQIFRENNEIIATATLKIAVSDIIAKQ